MHLIFNIILIILISFGLGGNPALGQDNLSRIHPLEDSRLNTFQNPYISGDQFREDVKILFEDFMQTDDMKNAIIEDGALPLLQELFERRMIRMYKQFGIHIIGE